MGWRGVELGPIALGDGVLSMRSPRLRDAAAWSAARRANREWLEPAFPAWGDDWDAEQSPAAWVQRWFRLRVAASRGLAKPFVLVLDGTLIGELGIDAVDPVSSGGEASVWMVRSHGSADVMNCASLLLLEHSFRGEDRIDRLVSPVATSSRKGRSPGLTAVGLSIEATIPRRVGSKGMVEHDIWVAQNTEANRTRVTALLRHYSAGVPVAEQRAGLPLIDVARAAVRSARDATRALRHPVASVEPPLVDRPGITLRREQSGLRARVSAAVRTSASAAMTEWQLVRGTDVIGTVAVAVDDGTASAEIIASADHDRDALRAALRATLAAVEAGAFGSVRAAVRVPLDTRGRVVPDDQMLAEAGLQLVATFPGNPEGRSRWGGEERWEPPRTA